MKFHVLTLFPEMITGGLCHSIIKRALENGVVSLNCVNIRDFAGNKHNSVDDYPYGGGLGMIMQAEPVYRAYKSLDAAPGTRVVYMTPQGKRLTQKIAAKLICEDEIIILCGRYEGVDERVIEEIVTDEISLGDFVLTGGEIAAMALMDCVSRLVPGVLGKDGSSAEESFAAGLLEYPQYTRPPVWMGRAVPEILLSGDHGRVDEWRLEQSVKRTRERRPDIMEKE